MACGDGRPSAAGWYLPQGAVVIPLDHIPEWLKGIPSCLILTLDYREWRLNDICDLGENYMLHVLLVDAPVTTVVTYSCLKHLKEGLAILVISKRLENLKKNIWRGSIDQNPTYKSSSNSWWISVLFKSYCKKYYRSRRNFCSTILGMKFLCLPKKSSLKESYEALKDEHTHAIYVCPLKESIRLECTMQPVIGTSLDHPIYWTVSQSM